MSISVDSNKLIINSDEIDIYASLELKDCLEDLLEDGRKNVILDLSRVSSLSTPAIQAILSASGAFNKLDFKKYPLNQSVIEDFKNMGIDL